MAQVQVAKRQLNLKIAYYGAPGAGKATTLRALEEAVPPPRGRVSRIELDAEAALRFECQPGWLETVKGLRVTLQLFSVPGDRWRETHPHGLVLQGADAVVFVVDSRPAGLEAARAAWAELEANLARHDQPLAELPVVFQWNRRDAEDALSVGALLDAFGRPEAIGKETVACRGLGVIEPVRAAAEAVTDELRSKLEL